MVATGEQPCGFLGTFCDLLLDGESVEAAQDAVID
jgi:hypothetical protein